MGTFIHTYTHSKFYTHNQLRTSFFYSQFRTLAIAIHTINPGHSENFYTAVQFSHSLFVAIKISFII